MRGRSGPEEPGRARAAARRGGRGRSRSAGGPDRATAEQFRGRPRSSPRRSKDRAARLVGVETQDLRAGGRALKARRERSAPAEGGSRRRWRRAERARRRRKTADRPALPFRSPAPRPAQPVAGRRRVTKGLAAVRFGSPAGSHAARDALPRSTRARNEMEVGANHLAHGESSAALCHLFGEHPPRLSWGDDV